MSAVTDVADLWVCRPSAVTDPSLKARYRELLSDRERARLERFRFDSDRDRHLIGRAMTRVVLSQYSPHMSPEQWQLVENAYGKPAVAERQNPDALEFNLSHSHDMVVCAVTRHARIGVDVEPRFRLTPILELAKRFFSTSEFDYLMTHAPPERANLFWTLWTLKEAYIKAVGMGVSIPLDSFEFELDASGVRLFDNSERRRPNNNWRFWSTTLGEYNLSLCRQAHGGEGVLRPAVYWIVPLNGYRPCRNEPQFSAAEPNRGRLSAR